MVLPCGQQSQLTALHTNAAGYHFTNTLIHVISCALVTVAVLHEFGPRRRLLAAVASLVFALHPVHVEVVANITSRAETLSSVWMIGSVVCYMWATDEAASRQAGASADAASLKRQWGWTVASLLLVVIGVLCKETSIVTPALLVACVVPPTTATTTTPVAHANVPFDSL